MKLRFDDLHDWEFEIDEVSAGVYTVTGRDRRGHHVSRTGEEPELLLEACKSEARETARRGSS